MFLRVVHGLLIFVLATAPLVCCGNGAPRAASGGCCQACESGEDTVGHDVSSTSPPGPDPRGCEMCQCICAGAVLEPFRGEQRLKDSLGAIWGDGDATIRPGELAVTGAPHTLNRDLFDPPSGRTLRTLYQSFLC
jgi:hypothetical protein